MFLRVQGIPDNDHNNTHFGVYALGDCATMTSEKTINRLVDWFKEADTNKDGVLSVGEVQELFNKKAVEFPQLRLFTSKLNKLFAKADANKSNSLTLSEFRMMLVEIDNNTTRLPATAQVARQQGNYLAETMNQGSTEIKLEPFKYK